MRLRSVPFLAAALLPALLVGCASSPASDAAAAELAGRWLPTGFDGETTPFLQLDRDGAVLASDGCNGSPGEWQVAADGAFETSIIGQTEMGCDGVPVIAWVMDTATVELDDDELVLVDDAGVELGRLTRG
jgi:heat shock protein HslJ